MRGIRDGSAVVVSDNVADHFGLRPGDEITIPAPAGPTPLRVSAIVTNDFSGDRGSIIIHRDRFAALWGGDTQEVNPFVPSLSKHGQGFSAAAGWQRLRRNPAHTGHA